MLCLTLFFTIGLSIGAGYHRLYSHRAYEEWRAALRYLASLPDTA